MNLCISRFDVSIILIFNLIFVIMKTDVIKILLKPNCSSSKLFPGEFPFCGNCIHYSGTKVCPVSGVSVNFTSDGTGCVMTGVYQKKTCAKDSVM